jgi:hypothetical protein
MKTTGIAAALAAISGCLLAGDVLAQDNGLGLDVIHEQRREGGRVCMSEHFHSGTAYGQPSKKLALASATRDWAGFTAWEYGMRWGSWNQAASKTSTCEENGKSWSCTVQARPCRRAGR